MTRATLRSTLFIAVFILSSVGASAQWRSRGIGSEQPGDVVSLSRGMSLLPGGENVWSPDQVRLFLSAYLGLNHNTNLGNFATDCDCSFDGSFGLGNIGAVLGVDVTYQFAPTWAVIAKAYYDNKHTKEALEREVPTPIRLPGSVVVINDVRYEEVGTVSLSYLTFGLFARWQPRLERWYIFAGPTVGLPSSTAIEHNQTIVTQQLSFPEQQSVSETKRNVSTADFQGAVRLEGMVGFGYDYIVRPRWYLNPEIKFAFPVTKITDKVNDRNREIPIDKWQVMSVQFSIGLKYEAF
jgi:hypothetical protein